jgi:exopolysaccharide biosynthesis polyprenyl glycosylphosphotransferase
MKSSRRLRQFLLLCVDVGILFLSLFFALTVRSGHVPNSGSWQSHIAAFVFIFAGWLLIFAIAGLYDVDKESLGLELDTKLFWAILVGILISVLFFYMVPTDIGPRTTLAIIGIFSYALMWLWRKAYSMAAHALTPRRGVVFVGMDPIVPEIVAELHGNPRLGYEASAIYEEGAPRELVEGLDSYGDAESFVWNAVRRNIRFVIMSDERKLSEQARGALFSLISLPARFIRLPDFYEMIFQKVPVGSINDLWFLENIDLDSQKPYELLKRGLDIALAVAGLALSLPFFPFIMAAIRIDSPGPAFFHQTRLGKGGKTFMMRKFRTMRTTSNDQSPTGKSDARITRLGSILRKTRVDELPQMLNIIKGEMSFVGPRPERPELAQELERSIPFYLQRLLVKPGVTGWDQVSGEYHSPSVEDTYKKLQYDLYYVKNLSPILDISILLRTVMTILKREGR